MEVGLGDASGGSDVMRRCGELRAIADEEGAPPTAVTLLCPALSTAAAHCCCSTDCSSTQSRSQFPNDRPVVERDRDSELELWRLNASDGSSSSLGLQRGDQRRSIDDAQRKMCRPSLSTWLTQEEEVTK